MIGNEPERREENPSKGHVFSVAVRGPAGEREEKIDLTQVLGVVFNELGQGFRVEKGVVTDVVMESNSVQVSSTFNRTMI